MISKIEKIIGSLSDEGKNEEVSSRREFLGNLAKIGAVAIAGNEISDRILGDEAEAHGKRHEHKTVEDYYKEGDYRQAISAFNNIGYGYAIEDYVYEILAQYKVHGKDFALRRIQTEVSKGKSPVRPYLEELGRRIRKDHHVDDFSIKAYSNYLKGMNILSKGRTTDNYKRALTYFKRAVEEDRYIGDAWLNYGLSAKILGQEYKNIFADGSRYNRNHSTLQKLKNI